MTGYDVSSGNNVKINELKEPFMSCSETDNTNMDQTKIEVMNVSKNVVDLSMGFLELEQWIKMLNIFFLDSIDITHKRMNCLYPFLDNYG